MKQFRFNYVSDQVRRTKTIKAMNETEAWIIFRNHVSSAEQIRCKEVKPSYSTAKLRDEFMRSLGLTKGKGNLGGTYWE